MIGVLLAASALFLQGAPLTNPAGTAAVPTSTRNVSPVTVTGQGSHTTAEAGGTIICHDEVRLGSLFPKRICARKDDILDRTRVDQQNTREATNLRPYVDEAASRK